MLRAGCERAYYVALRDFAKPAIRLRRELVTLKQSAGTLARRPRRAEQLVSATHRASKPGPNDDTP